MKPGDTQDDKHTPYDAEGLDHIHNLEKKLYTNNHSESAVRERSLKQHHIDVGNNWEETDQKNAQIAERERIARERELAGLASANALHRGSTQYGHYSVSENMAESAFSNAAHQPIQTKISGSVSGSETVQEFLHNTFADHRAEETRKKMAGTDSVLKYASAKAEAVSLYPKIGQQAEEKEKVEAAAQTAAEEERYHPDVQVMSVGARSIDGLRVDTRKSQSIPKVSETQTETPHDQATQSNVVEQKSRKIFGTIFFICITLFFVASIGYTWYQLQQGQNTISADKITLAVTGPVSVRSGEVSDFIIDITNTNTADVILSDLIVQYPEGTRSAVDTGNTITDERIDVGTIKPGQTVRRKASAVFFGEENVKKKITYTYEFNIEDSTTVFTAHKDIGVFIASSPVVAKIINVNEVINNQDLSFDIEVTSNSEEVIKDLQLKVEYPFGYELKEATRKPVADNNTWDLGDIPPLGKVTFTLKGRLVGTNNLEKNFRFILGVSDGKTGKMTATLSTQDQRVLIKRPFVTASLLLNGIGGAFNTVYFEDQLQGNIFFTNNLKVPITDVVVTMAIGGVIIDRETIKAEKGFYRSTDDVIFWDKSQMPQLALVNPGETKELFFNIDILEKTPELLRMLRRTSGNLSVYVTAKRLNENKVVEEIIAGVDRDLRLASEVTLESSIAYASGPFPNSGPFPPKVNTETTYTYVAKISNTTNALKDAVFTAKLPPNVTWKNIYSTDIPSSAISYSLGKREIRIQLGNIPSGLGIQSPAREVAFQIGFTPSLNQKGVVVPLILQPTIQGIDTFTEKTLQDTQDLVVGTPLLDEGIVPGIGAVE